MPCTCGVLHRRAAESEAVFNQEATPYAYLASKVLLSYSDGQAYCTMLGGSLATVYDQYAQVSQFTRTSMHTHACTHLDIVPPP